MSPAVPDFTPVKFDVGPQTWKKTSLLHETINSIKEFDVKRSVVPIPDSYPFEIFHENISMKCSFIIGLVPLMLVQFLYKRSVPKISSIYLRLEELDFRLKHHELEIEQTCCC